MRTLKLFAAVFLIALVVLSAIAMLARIPYPNDDYFALFTLGADQKTENYFPGDVVDILPGIRIHWFIGVYNHMGSVQLVKLKFKLLNLTMEGPDQLTKTPSKRPSFYEKTRLVLSNETWTLPLVWSINNATRSQNASAIYSILFNNEILSDNVEARALYGHNFRVVIELWVYRETTKNFSFVWSANGEQRCTWNQVWFNMTRTSLLS